MIRTYDEYLIRSILNHPDIYAGYEGINEKRLEVNRVIYLWCECGLFSCVRHHRYVNIHAAILPEYRGLQSIEAGKEAIKWLQVEIQLPVNAQVKIGDRKTQMYTYLTGFRRYTSDDNYIYYRA